MDADIRRGDDRFGLIGTVGPVPGRLAVASEGGKLTYTGSRLDVRARAWLGKTAALDRMRAAPAVTGGVSLVDGACVPGRPGCSQGAFCVAQRGCFGLQGYIDVSGLPEQVSVDLGGKTFGFSGFRPKNRTLDVYLASNVLSPVPVKARARLTGLPEKITGMSLGPITVAQGNAVQAAYRIEPAATLGKLDVRAEAAGLRGHLAIDPVPASVAFQGTYGAKTRIRVTNSAPVKHLSAKVTLPGKGTGELRFSDVPAVFGVDADASAAGLSVPAVTYKAIGNVNTLDGRLSVEGGLIDPSGRLGDVAFAVRDLAADTTVRLNPDQSLDLVSKPVPTGRISVRGGLRVDAVPAQKLAVHKEVPSTGGFLTYHVGGRFGVRKSSVEQVTLSISRMSWLRLRPGRIPFGLKAPAALGYVAPRLRGVVRHSQDRRQGRRPAAGRQAGHQAEPQGRRRRLPRVRPHRPRHLARPAPLRPAHAARRAQAGGQGRRHQPGLRERGRQTRLRRRGPRRRHDHAARRRRAPDGVPAGPRRSGARLRGGPADALHEPVPRGGVEGGRARRRLLRL
ncbi:hypothetical protein [Nonomuraea salmonea]|uniref:hypothetical protein n=1 Tax=Nonomuraea salmonea TaxID=46181 RepID=UPI0031ED5669